jgi:hypothetical protein
MVGVVFITSGWNDLKDPVARGKNIGLSKGLTIFLGAAELGFSFGTPDSGAKGQTVAADVALPG